MTLLPPMPVRRPLAERHHRSADVSCWQVPVQSVRRSQVESHSPLTAPGHEHAAHAPRYPEALEAANDWSDKARLCLAHCLVSFQEGHTTLATCARSVNSMISLCDAFAAQVANNSNYINGIAEACRAACVDCEKECRKHEDDHVECKQSADACARLVAAIDKL
jgi:Cys-rich four helix bundle protein (predicted Tat secretion target)